VGQSQPLVSISGGAYPYKGETTPRHADRAALDLELLSISISKAIQSAEVRYWERPYFFHETVHIVLPDLGVRSNVLFVDVQGGYNSLLQRTYINTPCCRLYV
jgi:hypothetical protein